MMRRRRRPAVVAALIASRASQARRRTRIRDPGPASWGVRSRRAAPAWGRPGAVRRQLGGEPGVPRGMARPRGLGGGRGDERSIAGDGHAVADLDALPAVRLRHSIGSSLVVGVTASDFLNRNWDVQQTDTVMPRDSALRSTTGRSPSAA